jgi:hypothetical protein
MLLHPGSRSGKTPATHCHAADRAFRWSPAAPHFIVGVQVGGLRVEDNSG